MLHALIMAGGGGTRFWPRSRKHRPKQFLTLTGDRTLLQQTQDRLGALAPPARTWVITGAAHAGETARQIPDLPASRIIGEPCGRDTAACIGLGAALMLREDPDAVMMVTPADHLIEPAEEFRRAAHVAAAMAQEHAAALITIGIVPTFPATGYGYIARGPEIAQRQGLSVYRVESFQEKPSAETAEKFVAAGRYYWNSGIFIWRAATILDALRTNQPTLAAAVERIAAAWSGPDREAVLRREYEGLTKISIDYAVMERAKEVLVVQAPFGWDDVGSWLALERHHPQDAHHNTVLANHEAVDTERCVIVGDADRLIATAGVRDLVIIQDGNAILVAHRDAEGAIKKLVEQMGKKGREEYL